MAKELPHRALLDVDGTLTVGPGRSPGEFAPLNTGVRAFLGALKDRGLEVIIFSARSPVEAVKQFFKKEGLDRYVDGYTRTKLPAKFIIDDRVVWHRGDFHDTLSKVDSFLPWWDKPNEYSCAMLSLPESVSAKIQGIAGKVDPADREKEPEDPHVTLLYGITEDRIYGVRRALEGVPAPVVTLGKLSLFETPKYDVLKVDVEGGGLMAANAALRRSVPHIETYLDYEPHATVAYLKKGTGQKYLDLPGVEGESFTLKDGIFSNRQNARIPFSLR